MTLIIDVITNSFISLEKVKPYPLVQPSPKTNTREQLIVFTESIMMSQWFCTLAYSFRKKKTNGFVHLTKTHDRKNARRIRVDALVFL
jgi:hypothetical protein